MSATNDGSESVDQFLARIASVNDGRDTASEDKTRRLEEEFLKNRKERQARRLERARSISPTKSGPMASQPAASSPVPVLGPALNPPLDFSPSGSGLSRSGAVRTSPTLQPKRSNTSASDSVSPSPQLTTLPPTSASTLSRSGTLSWQQRPSNKDGIGRPRPLSSVSPVRSRETNEQPSESGSKEPTREEIAASLGSKDASWFRQTQERGAASAAYRKQQVEDTPVIDSTFQSRRLPGLSPRNDDGASDSKSLLDTGPDHASPNALGHVLSSQTKTATAQTMNVDHSSHMSQRTHQFVDVDLITSSPSISTSSMDHRSPSPTKGLGGFVQSAMMKRSDSVNKRWSVQTNSGLRRGDSIAGGRSLRTFQPGHSPTRSVDAASKADDPGLASFSSTQPDASSTKLEGSAFSTDTTAAVSQIQRERSDSRDSRTSDFDAADKRLSRSPSKTLDPRRWSPTKSSWLETTLLSQTESPKLAPAREEAPQWMIDLRKSKSSRDTSPNKHADFLHSAKAEPPVLTPNESIPAAHSENTNKEKQQQQQSQPPPPPLKADNISRQDGQGEKVLKDTSKSQERLGPTSPARPESEVPSIAATPTRRAREPKPNPQTPPKTDFRATLRPHEQVSAAGNASEPEFKAIFGRLKPAQTKNYVAPDTFKNNILSGKAALATTDGPQKSKHVDEFKESILQKKETMRTNALQQKQPPGKPPVAAKPNTVVPEALAKRNTLHKSSPSATTPPNRPAKPLSPQQFMPSPIIPAKSTQKAGATRDTSLSQDRRLESPKQSATSPISKARIQDPDSKKSTPVDRINVDSQVKPDEPPTLSAHSNPIRTNTSANSLGTSPEDNVSSLIPSQKALPFANTLASRLNPDLAAMIARGKSPQSARSTVTVLHDEHFDIMNRARPGRMDDDATSELTHMTKARARGPKRRAPKTQPSVAIIDPQPKATTPRPEHDAAVSTETRAVGEQYGAEQAGPLLSHDGSTRATFETTLSEKAPLTGTTTSIDKRILPSQPRSLLAERDTASRVKPVVASKSTEVRHVSGNQASKTESKTPLPPVTPRPFDIAMDRPAATGNAEPSKTNSKLAEDPAVKPLVQNKSRINTSKQSQSRSDPPEKLTPPRPLRGLGLNVKASPVRVPSPLSMVVSVRTPTSEVNAGEGGNSVMSPSVDSAEIVLTYFTSPPNAADKAEFDTHALLDGEPGKPERVGTISVSTFEIGGDGKKSIIPPQQQHILFEESLYLVMHTYKSTLAEKACEAFLWCGDRISEAAVEDAQLFCKKDVRDHNAKLHLVKQGKEPAQFFQALGGIVITRRSKSSALYMLCGRNYLGHVAFDEVEMSPTSLCPGFCYLISTKFGKLYLWKGQGSTVDEVGCARLTGMDLDLTGEMEEVEPGSESAEFWSSFSSPHKTVSFSPNWQHRADHHGYPVTLYRVKHDRPKSVGGFWGLRSASPPKPSNKALIEVLGTSTTEELNSGNVHVLDAYHTVYVLLNQQTASKTAEVVTALHLAQEIAMLSPSIQGRTLMPASYVIFGEPPADVKACFRKSWSARPQKNGLPDACVRLEEAMQALQL